MILFLFASCGTNTEVENVQEVVNTGNTEVQVSSEKADIFEERESIIDLEIKDSDTVYIELDSENTQSTDSGVQISGQEITIKKSGNYEFSGVLNDGQIIVETEDEKNVQIILNNVEIRHSDSSAIIINNASQAVITLADNSENILSDGDSYAETGEDLPNATLFSTEDLVIGGNGSLEVLGNYNDGITSKDKLFIESGNISVTAKDDGIRGKDYLGIEGGNINITSEGDALISDNEEEGNIEIFAGNFTLSAGDDGVHAREVTITNGTIDIIKSYEGIEGQQISIDGGDIRILSSDDGFNAAGGNESAGDYVLNINGGNIYINASGDSIDSNADVVMTGGIVEIHGTLGSGSSLDYDGDFLISGGELIATGNGGRAKAPSTGSKQNSIFINFDITQQAGALISIRDSNDTEIMTLEAENSFEYLIVSHPDLQNGDTYSYFVDGQKIGDIEITDSVSIVGQIQSGR
ncbi:carbohydrate-binding domain-containing protein [Candidatus Gracilibacteria bacterium]|nr:carbohydrate-binding domain-containing protein [Candidatus Gracilibacteria bacterium]